MSTHDDVYIAVSQLLQYLLLLRGLTVSAYVINTYREVLEA